MKIKSIICSIIAVLLTLSSLFLAVPANIVAYAASAKVEAVEEDLPEEYCMRDEYIIYAQNQDSHGYCWNFASSTAAATTIMKATGEYYDFSEAWTGVALYNYHDQFKKMGQGGGINYHYDAMKKSGLMLETDLPYQESYTSVNENAADYYNFYEKYSNDDLAGCLVSDKETSFSKKEIDEIKSHIYNHGSIYLTFVFRTGFVESDGAYYLEPNQKNTTSNHAVSVIGWDDNFQREFYLDGSSTPTVFKGAWIILNSYTEKSGNDGISFVFYNDENIGVVQGYRYEPDTSRDLYFYDKIESGYSYPTSLKGRYYGDYTPEAALTKQKNIFYDDVNLEYSYIGSKGVGVEQIDIYLDGKNLTESFNIRIDNNSNRFYVSKENAEYGQYKMIITYGNGEKSDTYLNNFFVTHGLVGEEIEYDYDNNRFTFNPGRDLEYYSFISSDKNYVVYTNSLNGKITFLPTEQSVYSEKNMSLPNISYEITNGESSTSTYTIKSDSGYELDYNFIFEYYEDSSLQPVNVYYDLGGGVNNSKNYSRELASPSTDLLLYEPTRPGYTFAGWYLNFGSGYKKITEIADLHYVSWDDICHLGENPGTNGLSYYKNYYNNSNTLFVYAHWEELDYYNIDITINGNGTSQINERICISEEDSVRYLLNSKSGWCLSEVKINDVAVNSKELAEIAKYGLQIKNPDRDISITATFSEGVYLSLNLGDNIKTAYLIGTLDGVAKKFYDGDFIPKEYFTNPTDRFDKPDHIINPDDDHLIKPDDDILIKPDDILIKPDDHFPIDPDLDFNYDDIVPEIDKKYKDNEDIIDENFVFDDVYYYDEYVFENSESEKGKIDIDTLSGLMSPMLGDEFTLVVELYDAHPGCTYVLDDQDSYTYVEKGVYAKNIVIKKNAKLKEIDVGSATKMVEISYSVNSNVLDHYLSTDINAESGDKNLGVYSEEQAVYLFIKLPDDTDMYRYVAPTGFELVGDGWYRLTMFANVDDAVMGEINVQQQLQTYTVTWNNWDGSLIYSEIYSYGDLPVFSDSNTSPSDRPTRPADKAYEYIFAGWDKDLDAVISDVTYTATYLAEPVQYTITVEHTENGSVTPDGSNSITNFDRHTYIFTPDLGYMISDVLVNGESVGALPNYTFSDVSSNQTLRVEFERIKYAVNIICGENGSTDIGGVQQIEHGSSITLNISAFELFAIDAIKVNGVEVESTEILKIDNITKDTLVEISFKQVRFNITSSCTEGGSVTSSATVSEGENFRVDFKPKAGYRVRDVIIDGVSVGSVDHYTFVGTKQNHTLHVEYEVNTPMIVIISITVLLIVGSAVATPLIIKSRRGKQQAQNQESDLDQDQTESTPSDDDENK